MSRIGKRIIIIPTEVEITIDKQLVTVKGPKGTLKEQFTPLVEVKIKDHKLFTIRKNEDRKTIMLHGTTNSLIKNMIQGVSTGFKKELEINGVGYNVVQKDNKLVFSLGYSHKIELDIPTSLIVTIPKATEIIISGISNQAVGQFASKIKALKKPEPYGGKGIKYKGETIIRKAGKTSSK